MSYRDRPQQGYTGPQEEAAGEFVSNRPRAERLAPCEDAKKMSQVESAVTRLASLVNSLGIKIGDFETILAPVLRQEPTGPECGGKDVAGNVALANELRDIGDKIELALGRLQSMRERIEL